MERADFNKLFILLLVMIAGLLFFNQRSWLGLDFINKHETEFQVYSERLIKSAVSFNFKSFASVLLSQGKHPFLPVLSFAFFKAILLRISGNEFLILKAFYFLCYGISLICILHLSLLYSGRKIVSCLVTLFYALSCPYYYQTLLEGQAPEDLFGNTCLFLFLCAYTFYRVSLNTGPQKKIIFGATLVSLLLTSCFFSKYNIGAFILASIIVDLIISCFIFKLHAVSELKISYLFLPFFAALISWFSFATVRSQFFFYLFERLGVKDNNSFEPAHYLRAMFSQVSPFVHSIGGRWQHKYDTDMYYFYHWFQAALVLFCLVFAYLQIYWYIKHKKIPLTGSLILLPVIYVSINLLFFSFSKYRSATALISTIPVMWLIAGYCLGGILSPNTIFLAKFSFRKMFCNVAATLVLSYFLYCAASQYLGLNRQVATFMKLNNPQRLAGPSNAAINKISKCVNSIQPAYCMIMQQDTSFFNEYFSKLARYRLASRFSELKFLIDKEINSVRLGQQDKVFLLSIAYPSFLQAVTGRPVLCESGVVGDNAMYFNFDGKEYVVNVSYLPYCELKNLINRL